ncbi:MAG: hypothetical protein ACK4SF_04515 [Algoriphagus aquaeductus]|uniref:hypothetical protein n=1 Tax=Algoriphagus aquaeductus TaxID=475299 RepID=UPI0039188C22
MVKQVSIFVKPYIYKVLRRDYGYQKALVLPKTYAIYMHTNTTYPFKFAEPIEGLKEIRIEGNKMNVRKAYAIIRNIESQFRAKLNAHIAAKTETGYPSRAALREYLELYDILDEEINLDSLYKDWSRFKAKEGKRGLIPLWI